MSLCKKGVARAKVRAINGKPSVLYNDLLKRVDSRDMALEMYAKVTTKRFEELTAGLSFDKDANGEPNVDFAITFIVDNYNLNNNPGKKEEEAEYANDYSNVRHTIGDSSSTSDEASAFEQMVANELASGDAISMDTIDRQIADSKSKTRNRTNGKKKGKRKPSVEDSINEAELLDDTANTTVDNRVLRMRIYNQVLESIADSISTKQKTIASKLKNLTTNDSEKNREEIATLNKELTKLSISNAFYRNKIDKLDMAITTKELAEDVMVQLNHISKELDKPGLTNKMLAQFDKALKVWTNAASVFALDGDTEVHQKNIGDIVNKANIVNLKYLAVQNKLATKEVLEISTNPKLKAFKSEDSEYASEGLSYSVLEDFENRQDVNTFHAYTMAINRNPHTALQIIHKIVEKGHMRVSERTTKFNKIVDTLVKSIKNFDDFAETYADGRHTGMMLHYISPEFREKEKMFFEQLRRDGIYSDAKYRAKLDFIQANKIVLDARLLFPDKKDAAGNNIFGNNIATDNLFASTVDEESKAKHIADIIDALGGGEFAKEEFEVMKQRLEDRIDGYIIMLNGFDSQKPDGSNQNELDKFNKNRERFILNNSPYVANKSIADSQLFKDHKGVVTINHQVDTMPCVPRRYELNALGTANSTVETGNYNKSFGKIMSNPAYKEFYRLYTNRMNQLNSMLPAHMKFNDLTDNYVAMLDKSFFQLVGTEGIGFKEESANAILDIYSKNKKSVSAVNKYTGAKEYRLSLEAVNAREMEIDTAMKIAMGKKVSEVKRLLTIDEEFDIRRQVMHDINIRKRFDLGDSLKVFNYQVENYMHKVAAEDSVNAVKNILDHAIQQKEGKNGDRVNLSKDASFVNLKKQLDYYVEVFYGYDGNDNTSDKKVYTGADKKRYDAIVEAINQLEVEKASNAEMDIDAYEAQRVILESARDSLGQFRSYDQILHSALKYSQFKAMGFNYGAAITNMIQGYVANTIESKDGRIFNSAQLFKAYAVMGGSVASFYTGQNVSSETATKVRNLAQRYDLIGETSSELEFNKFNKGNLLRHVYIFQSSTEYLNQGPVIIATLMNTPVKLEDGSTISLWDALDVDGNIREDLNIVDKDKWIIGESMGTGDEFMNTMAKVTQAIRAIHGNYSKLSPTLMGSTNTLKAMKQFKTWMFESFAQRFELEKYDEALGMSRKGRYKTGVSVFTFAKPKGYEGNEVNAKVIFDNTLFTIGQTMKRLMFLKDNTDDRFEEVDAANVRKNIAETVFTIRFAVAALVLGSMLKGADDDDEVGKGVLRYQINVANRLIDDMQMYYSPTSLLNLTRNFMPVMSVLTDAQNFLKGVYFLMTGKVTKTGVYAGDMEWVRFITKSLPITAKIQSTVAMSNQVMGDAR